MKFRYKGKNYVYDLKTKSVLNESGNIIKDSKRISTFVEKYIFATESKGYSSNMSYAHFEAYISILSMQDREALFHKIYSDYDYACEYLNQKGLSTKEIHKIMARVKRYEKYLYKILIS